MSEAKPFAEPGQGHDYGSAERAAVKIAEPGVLSFGSSHQTQRTLSRDGSKHVTDEARPHAACKRARATPFLVHTKRKKTVPSPAG